MDRFWRLCRVLVGCAGALVVPHVWAALSTLETNTLLDAHNQVRSAVVPAAANMTRLVWDPALASVAQNWTSQCIWAHNTNRNADYAAFSANTGQVGENIFVTTSSRASALSGANSALSVWAAEVSDYNFSTNTCAPGKVCGHYTQLVWAKTLRVGCGITQCPSLAGLPGFNNAQFVVCNYNPAGNFVGQAPYVSGAPGSQCPLGLTTVVDNLCSPAAAPAPPIKVPAAPRGFHIVLSASLVTIGAQGLRRRKRRPPPPEESDPPI